MEAFLRWFPFSSVSDRLCKGGITPFYDFIPPGFSGLYAGSVSVCIAVFFGIILAGCFVSIAVSGCVFRAVFCAVFSTVPGIAFPVIFSCIIRFISVCFIIFCHLNYLLLKLILRFLKVFYLYAAFYYRNYYPKKFGDYSPKSYCFFFQFIL